MSRKNPLSGQPVRQYKIAAQIQEQRALHWTSHRDLGGIANTVIIVVKVAQFLQEGGKKKR
jgi:hypothetical protein